MSELKYPDDRRYHAEHLWAKQAADGSWVIGITDFAQDQLGEVIFIDLPEAEHTSNGAFPAPRSSRPRSCPRPSSPFPVRWLR